MKKTFFFVRERNLSKKNLIRNKTLSRSIVSFFFVCRCAFLFSVNFCAQS